MCKSIFIPRAVYECLNFFAPADRGMAYSAILSYIDSCSLPPADISDAARGAFEFARRIIDPILERKRKAAERRAARKATQDEPATQPDLLQQHQSEPSGSVAIPQEHLDVMRKVVDLAFKTCSTKARRDEKIYSEMGKRYPGMYRYIFYDRDGNVTLCPAS